MLIHFIIIQQNNGKVLWLGKIMKEHNIDVSMKSLILGTI